MARVHLVGPYLRAVARHWVWLVVAAVGAVGNGATLIGDFVVPRWAWWSVFAVGVLVAQFLAYADVSDDLALTRARLRDLDTDEAKRAYLGEMIAEAKATVEEYASFDIREWYRQSARLSDDLGIWETNIRAELSKTWGRDAARRFDSVPGSDEPDRWTAKATPDELREYVERRITRLVELRDETH